MKLIKITLIILVLNINHAFGYELLLPNALGQKSTYVAYYGKDLGIIKAEALKNLFRTNRYFNRKLNIEYLKNLDNIESARYWTESIIKSVKFYLTLKGLKKNILKGATKIKVLDELKSLGIDLTGAIKMTCDELGVKPKSTLIAFLETVVIDMITGKTPLDIILDSAEITNNIIAIVDVQKSLFYSLNSQIVTSYTEYLVKYLTGGSSQELFGKKALTLRDYLKERYMDRESNILTFDEYKLKYNRLPTYGDRLDTKIFNTDKILNWDDYSSINELLLDSPSVIVGGILDAFNDINKIYGNKYSNLLDYLDAMIYERLSNIDMTVSMIRVSIDDDLDSSKYSHTFVSNGLNIKEFSKIRVQHIGIRRNNDYSRYEFSCMMKKNFDWGRFGSRDANILTREMIPNWCQSSDNFSLVFFLKNNKKLNSYFNIQLLDRYKNIKMKLYKNIGLLKKNNIKFNDSKLIDNSRYILKEEVRTLFYSLRNYLSKNNAKNETSLVDDYFSETAMNSTLTYGILLNMLNDMLIVNYTNKEESYYINPFQDKDDFSTSVFIYPSKNSSLLTKKRIKTMLSLILKNNQDIRYRKSLENLSRAGILKLDLYSVSKKRDSKILFKDAILYVKRFIDYIEEYSWIKGREN